ncbi:hypothetical protein PEDI_13580 [Persicobacter diffluens]|uniref:Uncharacterized protein n=1 Tax=Persicobacter diffluens TaxID=981 RepID=A0AAN5AKV1_9BACT|nr:hypothetical protein PEDI_13580 [Persicobacter diffluens]
MPLLLMLLEIWLNFVFLKEFDHAQRIPFFFFDHAAVTSCGEGFC